MSCLGEDFFIGEPVHTARIKERMVTRYLGASAIDHPPHAKRNRCYFSTFSNVFFSPQLGHFWGLHFPSFSKPHFVHLNSAMLLVSSLLIMIP